MRMDVLTLFPEMIEQGINHSIMKRAADKGLFTLNAVNFREYTLDKAGRVDEPPYGGGAGMVLQVQPIDSALKALELPEGTPVIYTTPKGKTFSQKMAEDFAGHERLVFVCGHYEGLDQRIIDKWVTHEVSLGDYVLTGGELAVLVMMDAIVRLRQGVLGHTQSADEESFSNGLLEYPHYTRPPEFEGRAVPEILLSGHHANIAKWRLAESLKITALRRPELFKRWCESPERTKADKKLLITVMEELKELSRSENL